MAGGKLKAAIYCRLSEEDRDKRAKSDDSESIRNQKAMLTEYAAEQGWEVWEIYSDDDYAGSDRNRPQFQKLLEDARAQRFDIVLCKTQSRFTRELELVEKYINGLFPLWNIRFVSVVDNADTENLGNKKTRQINGLINEWYLEDMSDNIKSVLTSERRRGLHIGSFALYGYKKDPESKGHLIVDEEAASVVREVFSLYCKGYGKTAIARLLNERGIPNPTEYKRIKGLRYAQPSGRNSTLWKYGTIASMLKNEIYLGNMVQGRYGSVSYKVRKSRPRPKELWYRVENTHEPIIDRELWQRAQELGSGRARPYKGGEKGIFAGQARCASCGYLLHSSKSHGKRYLQCPNRNVSKDSCPGCFISEMGLREAVERELRGLIKSCQDGECLLSRLEDECRPREWENSNPSFTAGIKQNSGANMEADADQEDSRELIFRQCLARAYLDRARGFLSEEEFGALLTGLRKEREAVGAEENSMEAEKGQRQETPVSQSEKEDGRAAGSSIPSKSAGKPGENRENSEAGEQGRILTRELAELLIENVAVRRREPDTGNVPVEIAWRF